MPVGGGFTATFRVSAVGDDLALGCAMDGGVEAVYQFEVTETSDISASATASNGTLVNFSVRETDCASGAELTCTSRDPNGTRAFRLVGRSVGTYFLIVEIESGSFADVTLTVLPPAPNDICSTATPIQFVNGEAFVSGYTVGATNSTTPGDPSPSCGQNPQLYAADVVYSYTLTQAQDVEISILSPRRQPHFIRRVCGSPVLADEVFCTFDDAVVRSPTKLLNQAPGTYFLWFYGLDRFFDFTVRLAPPTLPPSNDLCMAPQSLFADGGTLDVQVGTTRGASPSFASCRANADIADVVYRVDLASRQRLEVIATPFAWDGGTLRPNLSLWPATDCVVDGGANTNTTNMVGCIGGYHMAEDTLLTVSELDAGAYLLVVQGADRTVGPFELTAQLLPVAGPPANDQCSSAELLTLSAAGTASTRGTTRGAVDDYTPPSAPVCIPAPSPEVAYSFTTPSSASTDAGFTAWAYVLSENTRELMPYVTLDTACNAGDAGQLDCGPARVQNNPVARVRARGLAPATTYSLSVGAALSTAPAGPFSLVVEVADQPANDRCSGATPLLLNTPLTGSLVGAYDDYRRDGGYGGDCEAALAAESFRATGPDVAYVFSPPATGTYLVTVTPTPGTVVWPYVFEGPCVSTSVCRRELRTSLIAGPRSVSFVGVAGAPVFIVADTDQDGSSARQFTIVVSN